MAWPCANQLCGGKVPSTWVAKRFCSERCAKEDARRRRNSNRKKNR